MFIFCFVGKLFFYHDVWTFLYSPVQGGVDAKDLFHKYIISWIQDKRISLLDSCKFDKVWYDLQFFWKLLLFAIAKYLDLPTMIIMQEKYSGVHTQHQTTPFIDEIHEQLKNILIEYEMIIFLWPGYTFALENVWIHLL